MRLTRRQAALLTLLTLVWGLNWPVMKLGVTGWPPLHFRAGSIVLGLPVLALVMRRLKAPFCLPRAHWGEVLKLAATNMLFWHIVAIVALQHLASGRAAILAYTMPVFSALWGFALYGQRPAPRQLAGVAAASAGVALLLWHEASRLAGAPLAAATMLSAAAVWAYGTQQLRRTTLPLPTVSLVFWMTALCSVAVSLAALVFEPRPALPDATVAWAIGYNAVLVFGFAQPTWFTLARSLPPLASTTSVMLIPVLGTVSGAWWLGETLRWQDGAAAVLMVLAIGAVLWPAAQREPA